MIEALAWEARSLASLEKVSFFQEAQPRMEMSFQGAEDLRIGFFEDTAKDRWSRGPELWLRVKMARPRGRHLGGAPVHGLSALSIWRASFKPRTLPAQAPGHGASGPSRRRVVDPGSSAMRKAWLRSASAPGAWDADASEQLLEAIAARNMSQAQGLLMAKVEVNRLSDASKKEASRISSTDL